MKRPGTGLVLALSVAAACWGSVEEPTLKGRMEVRWVGPDTGQVSAPATAEWCPERGLLEIRAVQSDTGIAMVLYPLDTIDADTYPVVPPAGADSLAPAAAVALRLFSPTMIKGYQGDSGNVVLTLSGSGEISGTVEARSRSVLNGASLRITGKFRDVIVEPQTRGCLPDTSAGSSADSAEADPEPDEPDVD